MDWKLVLSGLGVLLFLFVLFSKKDSIMKVLEWISVFWFRLALAFLGLFIVHIAAGFFGIMVPINIASGFIVAVLGIPGLASILTISIFL